MGVSFAELSRRTGISQQAMQRWWKGETIPELESRKRCAIALGVPVNALLLDTERESEDKDVNEAAIAAYIASDLGKDLSEEERTQLRLCGPWIPGDKPLTTREIHHMAEFVRMRLQALAHPPTAATPQPRKRLTAKKKRGRR
jgi:transcriptional regulator with XRE-family HTH domain